MRGKLQRLVDRHKLALQEALSLSEAALESTADGILVIDRSGGIRGYNRRFLEMWSIPRAVADQGKDEEALAIAIPQLKDSDAFLRQVRRLYSRPREESFDTLELKDGRVFERYSRPQTLGSKVVGRVWSFRDVTERRRLERDLSQASGKEQARLGRELHDTIGQTITAISLFAASAAAARAKGGDAGVYLKRMSDLSRMAHQQIRDIARVLLPPELESGDLGESLRTLTVAASELFGVRCSLRVRGRTGQLEPATAVELYRIAQEAVYNAAKHSRCRAVRIFLQGGAKRLRLEVVDNGIGLPARAGKSYGLGLRIMRYRAQLLGGVLELGRGPRKGTRVVCDAPRSTT